MVSRLCSLHWGGRGEGYSSWLESATSQKGSTKSHTLDLTGQNSCWFSTMDSHQTGTELTTAERVCKRGTLSKRPWVPLLNKWAPGLTGHFSDYLDCVTTDSPPHRSLLEQSHNSQSSQLADLAFWKIDPFFYIVQHPDKSGYIC